MKLIRSNVFETNSSSTHSITIADAEGLLDTLRVDTRGCVSVTADGFGWTPDTFNDADSKLAYMMIYVRDWCQGRQEEFQALLEKVVFEHTGATSLELLNDSGYTPEGYIDHQSVEDSDYHYLFEDDGTLLKNFIFNPKSELRTDNDNY